MKKSVFYILMLSFLTFYSCSEELLDDNNLDDPIEEKDDSTPPEDPDTSAACEYGLDSIPANETMLISCQIDLNGETITLNSNVELAYDGGDIKNGTIKFTNGKIDGRFLNKSLTVEGTAQLIDPTFEFIPSRWNIVEGQTTFRTALSNRLNLEKIISTVKDLSANTFKIDELDAYFEVSENTHPTNPNFYPWIEGISIPSNFNLEMTDNTHLRVFPNNRKRYALLALNNVSNVNISGGNVYGDRDEHLYNGGTHEWGHVVLLKGAQNTTVKNVHIKNGSGDGLKIEGTGFTFQSHYTPSHDVLVAGCTFDSNRRNNLSVTDGFDIIIEDNEFYRAGINTDKSKGINPRFSIDVEAFRKRENGKIVWYEKVDGVIIRNNYQRESGRGGFLVAVGDNVLIENNDVESGIAFNIASGTIIRNNILTSKVPQSGTAIKGGYVDTELVSNNKIYNNTIKNYATGISVYGDDHEVSNNKIENCLTGLNGKDFSNTKIMNNTIISNISNSRGIFVHYTSVNNVLFKDNTINVPHNPFRFDLINLGDGQENNTAELINNTFISENVGLLQNSVGISLKNNNMKSGIEVFDSRDFSIENNSISCTKKDGIYLRKNNQSVKLFNNQITVPYNKQCIKIESSTNLNEIEEFNTICLN